MRNILAFCCLLHGVTTNFELNLLHTNDVHSRIEEFDKNGNTCIDEVCFGGVARMAQLIKDLRKDEKNVLLLDGGDQFQGTLWFSIYKGQAIARFMNYIKYDAMVGAMPRGVFRTMTTNIY